MQKFALLIFVIGLVSVDQDRPINMDLPKVQATQDTIKGMNLIVGAVFRT